MTAAALAAAGCPADPPAPPGPPSLQAPPAVTATDQGPAPRGGQRSQDDALAAEGAPPATGAEPTPEPAPEPAPDPWAADEPINTGPPAPPAQPPAPPEIAREPEKDGAISRFPGIRIYTDEGRIEVDGVICLKTGPALEVMGCTRRGKTHESLLLFDCEPEQLYLSLVILGLVPTPQVDEFGQALALERGDRVAVEVSWRAADSPEGDPSAPAPVDGRVRRRVEDLIWDRVAQGPMPRVGWVFTGSRHVEVPAPPDWKQTMRVFAATYGGNIAATYHDPDAVLDTPLLEGGDDTIYLPYSERLPERGTEVIVHLRPFVVGQDGPAITSDEAPGAEPGPGEADAAPADSATPAPPADVTPPARDAQAPGAAPPEGR